MSSVPIVLEAQAHIALDWRSAAFFAAVYVAAAFATRARPVAGVAIMLALDPFSFPRYVGDTTITIPKIVLLAVVTGLVLRSQRLDALRDRRIAPLAIAAAAVVVATALTWFPSGHRAETMRETLKAAEYFAAFVVAIVACASDPDERVLYRGLLVGAVAAIALAIAQDYTTAPAAIALGGHLVPRIAGPLEGPNQLAGYLEIVLPTLLAFRFLRGANLVLDLALIAGTFAAILTFSRAGQGGLVLGLVAVVVAVQQPRFLRSFVATTATVGGVFAILFGQAVIAGGIDTARPSSDAFSGLGTRTDLWRAAWAMWRAHPVLGVGAGNFELEIGDVGPSGVRTHANSLYLQALAEGGIVMLAATIGLLVTALVTLVRYARSPLAIGALGATVALATHQVFDDVFFFPKVGELWWTLLGVAAATIAASGRLRPE